VLETREHRSENAVRRRHACRGCGKAFTSIQRIEAFQDGAWQPVPLAAVPDPQPLAPPVPAAPRRRVASPAPDRLHPLTGDEDFLKIFWVDLPTALLLDLFRWWNESRWGKHRTQATWTQAAFTLSANRVSDLVGKGQMHAARALVDGGIEHGWQALKPEYLRGTVTPSQYLRGTVTPSPAAVAPAGDPAAAAIRDMLERADAA
jgi:hypothetical protein